MLCSIRLEQHINQTEGLSPSISIVNQL